MAFKVRSVPLVDERGQVIALSEMSDGTVVSLRVGNDENFCGELRNNTAVGDRILT